MPSIHGLWELACPLAAFVGSMRPCFRYWKQNLRNKGLRWSKRTLASTLNALWKPNSMNTLCGSQNGRFELLQATYTRIGCQSGLFELLHTLCGGQNGPSKHRSKLTLQASTSNLHALRRSKRFLQTCTKVYTHCPIFKLDFQNLYKPRTRFALVKTDSPNFYGLLNPFR